MNPTFPSSPPASNRRRLPGAVAVAGATLWAGAAAADVTLSDTRTFATDDDTRYTLDGASISKDRLREIGPGLVARVDVGDDVSSDFTSGTALSVDLDNLLKGPVTSLDPLTVLRQPVVVTGDTVLADLPGGGVAGLAVGDVVEVSGFADADNSVRATRLEFKPNGAPVWKLTGIASAVATGRLSIGAQTVDFGGVAARDCDGGLSAGRLVEIKTAADGGFSPGATLTGVTAIECLTPGLDTPVAGTVPAAVEGLVTAIAAPDRFVVNGQQVRTTSATVYRDGSADDVVPGARLEAQGRLDAAAGVLTALRIAFRDTPVRIEAPATPNAVVAGESVTLLGITVRATAQTRDEDGILAAGLTENLQLEVRGFRDRNGQLFATRVRERGDPEPDDVRLRGPVSAVDPPRFDILGVTVDTANSVLPPGFFSAIGVGVAVQIEDARFDAASGTLSGGRVEIEPSSGASRRARQVTSAAPAARAAGSTAPAGTGIGTVTRIGAGGGGGGGGDVLFSNDFENGG